MQIPINNVTFATGRAAGMRRKNRWTRTNAGSGIMRTARFGMRCVLALWLTAGISPGNTEAQTDGAERAAVPPDGKPLVEIGDRRELFIDDFMVDALSGGAERRLHHPVPREVIMTFGEKGKPWEESIAYATVVRDGDRILMYYSARFESFFKKGERLEKPVFRQYACVLESSDGIHFTRPNLGIYDISSWFPPGTDTANNNVIYACNTAGHNFTPFLDTRLDVPPEQRFKAIGRPSERSRPLAVFASPDGFHWEEMEGTRFANGPSDSQNGGFWDPLRQLYVAYMRGRRDPETGSYKRQGIRDIRTCVSKDLLHWTDPEYVEYTDDRAEEMYTNGIHPYERAPHIYIGLPARFVSDRRKVREHPIPSVSDAVLMSSRDGKLFDRWEEGFVRPGPEPEVWTDRNNYPGLGIIETSPTELSIYWTEHNGHPGNRLRRGTLRLDGFVSVHAGATEGELLTRPFVFKGERLTVNYATSAIGSLRFELCDVDGGVIKGFAMDESETLFGNEIEHSVTWKGGGDVSRLAGKPVRLRVRLFDADLYSFRFGDDK